MEEEFASADCTIKGEICIGGQEHFYMETNTGLARPLEDGGMEIISSTQHPQFVQVSSRHEVHNNK